MYILAVQSNHDISKFWGHRLNFDIFVFQDNLSDRDGCCLPVGL